MKKSEKAPKTNKIFKCPTCKKRSKKLILKEVEENHRVPARIIVLCPACETEYYIVKALDAINASDTD